MKPINDLNTYKDCRTLFEQALNYILDNMDSPDSKWTLTPRHHVNNLLQEYALLWGCGLL